MTISHPTQKLERLKVHPKMQSKLEYLTSFLIWLLTMMELFITLLCTWYYCGAVDCILHSLAHLNWDLVWIRSIHDIHMIHHKQQYPVGELLKPPPYSSGDGLTGAHAFLPPIVLLTLGSAYLLLCIGLSTSAVCLFIVESAWYLWISNYLHEQYHIDGSWLERFEWFLNRRSRHFYHHHHMHKNMSLGGIDSTIDRLLNTFVEIDEYPKNKWT